MGTPTYTWHLRPAHATPPPTHPPPTRTHTRTDTDSNTDLDSFALPTPAAPPPHYLLYCIQTLSFVYSLPLPLPFSTAQLTFHDKVYARKFGRNDPLCAIDDRGSEREQEAREWRECARSEVTRTWPCAHARCARTHRPAFVWPRQHLWSFHTWSTVHTQHGNLQGGGVEKGWMQHGHRWVIKCA